MRSPLPLPPRRHYKRTTTFTPIFTTTRCQQRLRHTPTTQHSTPNTRHPDHNCPTPHGRTVHPRTALHWLSFASPPDGLPPSSLLGNSGFFRVLKVIWLVTMKCVVGNALHQFRVCVQCLATSSK